MITTEDTGVDCDGRRVEATKLLDQQLERLCLGIEGTRDHHPAHGLLHTITTLRAGPGRAGRAVGAQMVTLLKERTVLSMASSVGRRSIVEAPTNP